MRRLLAKVWVVLFAVSYSAAAIAAHCQTHFAVQPPVGHEASHDCHGHDAPDSPAPQGDCVAMAWAKILAPAPDLAAPASTAPEIVILLPNTAATHPVRPQTTARAEPRPPPDPAASAYAAQFARTGRLHI